MNNLLKKMNKGTYICWIGCVLGIIALFVPFVKGDSYIMKELERMNSVTWISGTDGKIFLVIFIALAVIALFHKAVLSMIGAVILMLFTIMDFASASDMIAQNSRIADVSMGIGMYLLVISSLLVLVSAILYLVEKVKSKKNA